MIKVLQYSYDNPLPRIIVGILCAFLAVLFLISFLRSGRVLQELREEQVDFADEFIIMYRTNRIILFVLCVLVIIYLSVSG